MTRGVLAVWRWSNKGQLGKTRAGAQAELASGRHLEPQQSLRVSAASQSPEQRPWGGRFRRARVRERGSEVCLLELGSHVPGCPQGPTKAAIAAESQGVKPAETSSFLCSPYNVSSLSISPEDSWGASRLHWDGREETQSPARDLPEWRKNSVFREAKAARNHGADNGQERAAQKELCGCQQRVPLESTVGHHSLLKCEGLLSSHLS